MAVDPITAATIGPCEWCKNTDRLALISDWEEHGSFAPACTRSARMRPQTPRRLRGGLSGVGGLHGDAAPLHRRPVRPRRPGLTFYAPG